MNSDHIPAPRFYATSIYQRIAAALGDGISFGKPIQVVGKPGTGKSTALRKLASEWELLYVEADFSTKGIGNLMKSILKASNGFDDTRGKNKFELAGAVKELLQNGNRLYGPPEYRALIVDEAHQLEDTALMQLVQFGENTDTCICLAGNHRSLRSRNKSIDEALEPVRSRIFIRVDTDLPKLEDFNGIATEWGVEGMDAHRLCARFGMARNIRELCHVLDHARLVSAGNSISLSAIETAIAARVGGKELELLSKPLPATERNAA